MEELSIYKLPYENKEDVLSYQPYFTEVAIKTRSRIVVTSSNQWDIGESETHLINFDLIESSNLELIDQVKYVMAWFVRQVSPGHAHTTYNAVLKFLNECDNLDDESGKELTDAFSDELLYYFSSNRNSHNEDPLHRIRLWYLKGVRLRLPLFQPDVGRAIKSLSLKGRVKGLDVLVHIPGKSPLSSNKLFDLRSLLTKYQDHFSVGESEFWKMAATWVFITLGIRPIQLRLLMMCDLALNIEKTTGKKSYILNVPSAKKRHQLPRTRFKSRPIPTFLGEMLESLKEFNVKWLDNNGIKYNETQIPLFFLLPYDRAELRKETGKIEAFRWTMSNNSISKAVPRLLELINSLQYNIGAPTFDEPITARRLRKTFATHAAAVGTPAMMLMELLDHEDMQHVMIYYKLGANFANKVDQVYREQFGTIFDYFSGVITLEELSTVNKSKHVYGPENLRRLVGIGFCSKEGLCKKAPPYSCYTCIKFEACNNKQIHIEVLECMLEDVSTLFEQEPAPAKFEINHISACRSLIAQLENS
ncbi:tyrosine-type recombinase/integrase [Aeromonas hydrophila]|uniref:tyrosine-type recombinase/integrase n=1 Tax=Aeromonas hydrophila TaxID=644 RepID=UPI003F79F9CC|nr:tyrosine-type recombinase/integrase [Aeromonas hydrophila]